MDHKHHYKFVQQSKINPHYFYFVCTECWTLYKRRFAPHD